MEVGRKGRTMCSGPGAHARGGRDKGQSAVALGANVDLDARAGHGWDGHIRTIVTRAWTGGGTLGQLWQDGRSKIAMGGMAAVGKPLMGRSQHERRHQDRQWTKDGQQQERRPASLKIPKSSVKNDFSS